MEINVYLYEWPGFGHSSGVPSEKSVNEAIEAPRAAGAAEPGQAAYNYVTSASDKRIVLMGHSLGAIPCCML